eukprot:scaffold168797_cov55-Attheya_sp.AAC.1
MASTLVSRKRAPAADSTVVNDPLAPSTAFSSTSQAPNCKNKACCQEEENPFLRLYKKFIDWICEDDDDDDDDDKVEETKTEAAPDDNNGKKKEAWYNSWVANVFLWLFLFVLVYHAHVPEHVKKSHMKVVDAQLGQMASSLSESKASLANQIDAMASSLEVDKADIGIVSRSHHEEELNQLKQTNEEMEKVTKEKQAQIDLKEEEIKKLKAQMATMSLDISKFCADCPFNYAGLRTTCGARMNYLVVHHTVKEEDAKMTVMKVDANCSK